MIDLRKKDSAAPSEEELFLPRRNLAPVEWVAPEYEVRERSAVWLIIAGGIALLFVLAAIFLKNYFFVAFVAIGYGIFLAYQRRAPRSIQFSVSPKGVTVGSESYEYSDFKSFWIFDSVAVRELSFETQKTLTPFLRLPLGDASTKEIRKILEQHLPEEEHQEFISDKIARSI